MRTSRLRRQDRLKLPLGGGTRRLPRARSALRKIVLLVACLGIADAASPGHATQKPVAPPAVLRVSGLLHGFLLLKTAEGETLADGELIQVVHGDRISSHLIFRFKDSSFSDEAVVFSQRRVLHLLSYHLVQKGPAFKVPLEFSLNGATGEAKVHYTDNEGREKTEQEKFQLPADVANGFVTTVILNMRPNTATTVSFVAATPKPRMVKLQILQAGEDAFSLDNSRYKALHYVVKVDIPGVAGIVAPIVGKKPADTDIWVLSGEAPVFLRSEGPNYLGGPIWRIELASPTWANQANSAAP